jgi:hypothetical protein
MSAEAKIQNTQYKPQMVNRAAAANETKYIDRGDIDRRLLHVRGPRKRSVTKVSSELQDVRGHHRLCGHKSALLGALPSVLTVGFVAGREDRLKALLNIACCVFCSQDQWGTKANPVEFDNRKPARELPQKSGIREKAL